MSRRSSYVISCSALAIGAVLLTSALSSPPEQQARGEAVPDRPSPAASAAPRETSSPAAAAAKAPAKKKPAADRLALFKGLGAWVDLFDFGLDPTRTAALMKRNGVRTLYLQTGHSYTRRAIDPAVGPWLVASHRAGIKVVGWYLPGYRDWRADAHRTAAIARYSYRGHRFDGIGIDVENRDIVKNLSRWNARVTANAKLIRQLVGRDYPVATIPPTPLQMRVLPDYWRGFPWRSLARYTDAMVLMSYWSDRGGCPRIPQHCAYRFTTDNVKLTRRLTGRPDIIVHVAGGIGDKISYRQLRDFVRAVRDVKADGASIYDVVTTHPGWWRTLRTLRTLD